MQNGIPVGLRSSPSFGLSRSGQLTAIIQSLFWDGSQGWWYDDNDTTTLFQDSAGTTPVTAVEQFVGLQLDKSKGLVLGPELINNAAWTVPAGWSVNSTTGVATGTNVTGFIRNNLAGSTILVVGRWYQATIRLVSYTSGTVGYPYDGTGFVAIPTTPGTYTYRFLCDNSDYTYVFGTAFTGVVDSISVRELPGNHRYAPASGNRPIWSKRVNLLTKTEQFDDAAWIKNVSSVSSNAAVAPNGTTTADKIIIDNGAVLGTSTGAGVRQQPSKPAASITFTESVYAKAAGFNSVMLFISNLSAAAGSRCTFNLVAGTFSSLVSFGSGFSGASASIEPVGDNWYRCVLTTTSDTDTTIRSAILPVDTVATQGDGTSGIFVWGADFRPANQATGLLPLYQRVNTSTDYETNGFPGYLKADGVDDFLQTNSIDFSAGPTNPPLGPELVTNGTFDTNINGWTAQFTSTASWQSGALRSISSGTNAGEVSSPITCVIGRTYRVTGTVLGGTSTGRITASSSAFGGSGGSYVASGNQTFCFVATATTMYIVCGNGSAANGVFCDYDNISVKEITNANLGADKITLCAGVRKLSDALTGVFAEISVQAALNNGAFLLTAPGQNGASSYRFHSRGTAEAIAGAGVFAAAPDTAVLTGIGNISGDVATIRRNGSVVDTVTTDQGTGNYGNYPAYFFRRAGTSNPFTGNEYGNIAVGKLLTADQLTALETYMNGLTKAY